MDVRCDRCQTEYELEDESVAERGASVQCTTCGHTFVVSRRKPELTPTPGPTTEMTAPAWLLTTEEGKTHRSIFGIAQMMDDDKFPLLIVGDGVMVMVRGENKWTS